MSIKTEDIEMLNIISDKKKEVIEQVCIAIVALEIMAKILSVWQNS